MFKRLENAVCPICGGAINETDKAYGCVNWKKESGACKFTLWKTCCGHTWTEGEARRLIAGETIPHVKFYSMKKNKDFYADARLDENGKIAFEFNSRKEG